MCCWRAIAVKVIEKPAFSSTRAADRAKIQPPRPMQPMGGTRSSTDTVRIFASFHCEQTPVRMLGYVSGRQIHYRIYEYRGRNKINEPISVVLSSAFFDFVGVVPPAEALPALRACPISGEAQNAACAAWKNIEA